MQIEKEKIYKIINIAEKPARYLGNELNIIVKQNPLVKMAISYPDLYEVGMSNNGIRILYDIANKIDGTACERVFAVAPDFEKILRDSDTPLFSLETYTPLCEFDIIGFNLSHELIYTNVLQILDLGRVPLLRDDRLDTHPIVIAGGSGASNPAPMSDFIDAFFAGDGEQGIVDILEVMKSAKEKSLSRMQILDMLAQIEGVYMPAKHEFVYTDNILTEIKGDAVKKRNSKILHNPENPVIPNMRITQERAVVEVTRGCKNMCRFCHAGYYELPYRPQNPQELSEKIVALCKRAPYNELTLSSLSVSDYRHLPRLLNLTLPRLIEMGVSISLPSLRVDKNSLAIIECVSEVRKTSLTFAVESACESIRQRANKRLSTDDLIEIIDYVYTHGWKLIKLYFMIGMPGCDTVDEAEEIIRLLKIITQKKRLDINITVSPFVPKPHTPFEREKQMSRDYFDETVKKIKRGLPRFINVKSHDLDASVLEGILSRGDTRLGSVIYSCYKDGCRLDSWKEHFKNEIWQKNLAGCAGLDWQKYLDAKSENEVLPWSKITTGFEMLLDQDRLFSARKEKEPLEEFNTQAIKDAFERFTVKYNVKQKLRMKFSKTGPARFYSFLDYIEIVKRGLRLADMPVAFTQGFNKHERIANGPAMAVGVESLCELFDVELYSEINAHDFATLAKTVNACLPNGIELIGIGTPGSKESISALGVAAKYTVETHDADYAGKISSSLQQKNDFVKQTKDKEKRICFKDAVLDYNTSQRGSDFILEITTQLGTENSYRIDLLTASLCGITIFAAEAHKFRITKTATLKKADGGLYVEIL